MRKVIIGVMCLVFMSSCGNYDYNISELPSDKMKFSELPQKIQDFFHDPSEYKWFNEEGIQIGIKKLIPIDNSNGYEFETKTRFVESWIAYYKLIDLSSNVSYGIDQGTPSPFVVFKNKLYLQSEFNVLNSGKDFNTLEFTCYTLK